MNFKKLKSQSGRSMVEMLGVLAIIGVLSVGGIAGYSLSMRRHRANQIADLASKYALYAYGLCQQKILNGEETDISNCQSDNSFSFENSGIGSLPSGVSLFYTEILKDVPTQVDMVGMSAIFDDDKLCQAVGSVMGSSCQGGNCVSIYIKQN